MSDSNDQPPMPSGAPVPGEPEGKSEAQPSHPDANTNHDPTEALKRSLEATRLPADWKEQILAELPPPEEQERMYRELMEKGGLSFEEFFESLMAEFEEQP